MSFLFGLFARPKQQCPRCLGKGHVDVDDITRLRRELKWIPGPCAYCNALGEVSSRMMAKVPVDTTYLTDDLPAEERQLLINGDRGALLRAGSYDSGIDALVQQIRYLRDRARLDASSIVEFFQISSPELRDDEKARVEFSEYVDKVISG